VKATAELLQCGVSIFTNTVPGDSVASAGLVITIYCLILILNLLALVLENLNHKRRVSNGISAATDGGVEDVFA
jgi:hypothetical protein